MKVIKLIILFSFLAVCTFAQKNLTVAEVYDFDIGDEFQYSLWHTHVDGDSPFPEYFRKTVKEKYYSTGGDTLFYKYNVAHSFIAFTGSPRKPEFKTTSYEENRTFLYLDSFVTWGSYCDTTLMGSYFIDTSYIDTNYDNRVVNLVEYWNGFEGGYSRIYIEGFGGPYGYEWSSPSGETTTLLYVKKGNYVWGNRIYAGINSIEFNTKKIDIYPNPNYGLFTIKLDNLSSGEIKIYNTIGKIVYREAFSNQSSFEIQLPHFISDGVYFIELISEAKRSSRRIVVQRE